MKHLVLGASEHQEGDSLEAVLNNVAKFAKARNQSATVSNILPMGQDHGGNYHYRVIVQADDDFDMKEPDPA